MGECSYLKKNGKKCSKKISKNEVCCSYHGGKSKEQSGGFLYEILYPMGASVGAATFALYKINNIVTNWYMDKNEKKLKKKKLIN